MLFYMEVFLQLRELRSRRSEILMLITEEVIEVAAGLVFLKQQSHIRIHERNHFLWSLPRKVVKKNTLANDPLDRVGHGGTQLCQLGILVSVGDRDPQVRELRRVGGFDGTALHLCRI